MKHYALGIRYRKKLVDTCQTDYSNMLRGGTWYVKSQMQSQSDALTLATVCYMLLLTAIDTYSWKFRTVWLSWGLLGCRWIQLIFCLVIAIIRNAQRLIIALPAAGGGCISYQDVAVFNLIRWQMKSSQFWFMIQNVLQYRAARSS